MPSIRVPKPIMITVDPKAGGRRFEAGVHHDVPDVYAEHWYAAASGVQVLSADEVEALTAPPPAPFDAQASIDAALEPVRAAVAVVMAEMGETTDDHALISVASLRALADAVCVPAPTDDAVLAVEPAPPTGNRRRKS